MQEYALKVEKYTSEKQEYTSEVQKYTFEVSKYKKIISKYKSIPSKYAIILSEDKSTLLKYKNIKYKSLVTTYLFFAFSLDIFSFCTGPQSWRNFLFVSSQQPFAWPRGIHIKIRSILRTFAVASFWLDPLPENLHPPSFPSCLRAALSLFLFIGVLPRRLEPAILLCFLCN